MGNQSVMDVLIIEDDGELSNSLKSYSERMGCFRNILQAGDGIRASHMISNQKFEVILVDINIPKKNGLKVVDEIAKTNCGNNMVDSVVIVSGELNKRVLQEATDLGVKNILVKPFDEETFQNRVLKVIVGSNYDG